MPKELIVVEKENVIFVAWANDPEDWVVRFDKQPGFPALQWAERMVYMNNHGGDKDLALPENNFGNQWT